MGHRYTTTEGFRKLEEDSRGRNRGPNERLMEALDPEGLHVAGFHFIHNDCELRVRWLVKLKGTMEAAEIWMDNGFEAFNKLTMEEEGK